jgi:hypothetical protein
MANKFRRSIQPTGFRPEQVSERNVSQLQAYSDRIAKALREERDAVISNRNDIANALKENAKIESQQTATNQKIQQTNLQTQLDEQTMLSKAALNEFDRKNKESQLFFKTLSGLSSTAGKKLQEQAVARNKKEYDNLLAEMLMLGENSPHYKDTEAMLLDANAEALKANTELAQAQERGLDPLEADRYAKNFNELHPAIQMGYLKILANKYNYFLTDQASADETGSALDGKKAGVWAANKLDEFLKIQGVKGVNPAFLQKSGFLETVLNVNQQYQTAANKAESDMLRVEFEDNFNSTLANLDAAGAQQFIETQWPDLVRRYGYSGALDYLTKLAKVVDEDGDPLYNTAAIMAAKVGMKGEEFGTRNERRIEIQRELAKGANAANKLDRAVMDREASEYVLDAILPSIKPLIADATPAEIPSILATARQQIEKKFDGNVPKSWNDYERAVQNESKAEAQQKATRARALMATGEAANINEARNIISGIFDPDLRKELVDEHKAVTNPIQLSAENKKTLDKSISAVSRELLEQSLEGGASNTALRLAGYIRTDAYSMYKEEFEKTRDQALALANVQKMLEQEKVKAQAGEPAARFRTATGKYNQTTFPGFEAEDKITEGQRDARLTTITNTVGTLGVNALHSPGLLDVKTLRLASEAAEQNISLNTIATKEILAIKKGLQTKGKTVTFGEIFNAQIAAHNANNPDNPIRPVGISPMLQIMDYSHLPTLEAITNNATVVNVGRAVAESSPNKHLLRDPHNLRSFLKTGTVVPYSRDPFPSSGDHYDVRIRPLFGPNKGKRIDPSTKPDLLNRIFVGEEKKPLTFYRMTSPYGPRNTGIPGASTFHEGQDYEVPSGKTIFIEGGLDYFREGGIDVTIVEDAQGNRYEIEGLHTERTTN